MQQSFDKDQREAFPFTQDVNMNSETDSTWGRRTKAADQTEVIAFLSCPASYAGTVTTVERIDTHGALVFLAGDHAYKLKRAVHLPYMDFSTLALREQACLHEIERNQAAAPDIYIAANPIVRSASGELKIGHHDGCEVIDWVVIMSRFDQAELMDNLAKAGQLNKDMIPPLGEVIASYHERAPTLVDMDGHAVLSPIATQIIRSFAKAEDILEPERSAAFTRQMMSAFERQADILRTRGRDGHIRFCHGDLHLRNIIWRDGHPVLFDAIEFDDDLARIDVLYDLAFLLMDLWHRGHETHANLCFNTYASRAISREALSGLSLLPLYVATRAAIRAMVTIDAYNIPGCQNQYQLRREIDEYFELACDALEPARPRLVAIGGRSGTGKSTQAAALAPKLGRVPGALHLRSDVERKRMAGVDPMQKLPAASYSAKVTHEVYERLSARATAALRAGHSVIVDATFLEPARRRQIERAAEMTGAEFRGLWLEADQDQLIDRVRRRTGDASDADEAVVRSQFKADANVTCWETIDAAGPFEAVNARACSALKLKPDYHEI